MTKIKITTLIIALGSLMMFNRCSNEFFAFVVPVPLEAVYDVEEVDGMWNESEVITSDDFEDILDDFEDDATVDDVLIEGVVLYLENQDPALTGVENANLVVIDAQNNRTIVYQNVSITLDTSGDVTRAVITDLVEDGIVTLAGFIEGYIDGTSFEPFTIESTGQSVPNGTPLTMTLTIEVNMTASIFQELEVPFFMGN